MNTKILLSTLLMAAACTASAQVVTNATGAQGNNGGNAQQPFSGQPASNRQRPPNTQYNPYAPPPRVPPLTNNVPAFSNSLPGFGTPRGGFSNVPPNAVNGVKNNGINNPPANGQHNNGINNPPANGQGNNGVNNMPATGQNQNQNPNQTAPFQPARPAIPLAPRAPH